MTSVPRCLDFEVHEVQTAEDLDDAVCLGRLLDECCDPDADDHGSEDRAGTRADVRRDSGARPAHAEPQHEEGVWPGRQCKHKAETAESQVGRKSHELFEDETWHRAFRSCR